MPLNAELPYREAPLNAELPYREAPKIRIMVMEISSQRTRFTGLLSSLCIKLVYVHICRQFMVSKIFLPNAGVHNISLSSSNICNHLYLTAAHTRTHMK